MEITFKQFLPPTPDNLSYLLANQPPSLLICKLYCRLTMLEFPIIDKFTAYFS
jgi:hypothetical protein